VLILVGMGLGVIFSLMGIINLAHGEFLMLGAYAVYLVNQVDAISSFWVGVAVAPIAVGLIALVIERVLIRYLYERPLETLLATWGLGIVLREGVSLIFGAGEKSVGGPLAGSSDFLGITYPTYRLFLIVASAVVLSVAVVAFTRTTFGLRIRATIERRTMAEAVGIDTRRMNQVTFALGAAIAGLAGALISPIYVASPNMGLTWLVPAFLVVILGGMGSVYGAVAGGLVIAILQANLEYSLSIATAQAIVFVAAIVIVRLRPRGILNFG
jgi:branched-chain amino acid transport system permease protein/urea transport system permease protein